MLIAKGTKNAKLVPEEAGPGCEVMAVYQLVCGAVTVYTGKKSFNLIRKLIITDLTIVGERNKNSFRHKKVDFFYYFAREQSNFYNWLLFF